MGGEAVRNISGAQLWLSLAASLALCFSTASTGALFPPDEWYSGLNKPSWTPPNWIFGPVWSALYGMMALAAWFVWQSREHVERRRAIQWFLLQLLLNAAWTPLFFGLHQPGLAFMEILLLWLTIAVTLRFFFLVDRRASWLLVPYLAWVSFAVVLNAALWRLNT